MSLRTGSLLCAGAVLLFSVGEAAAAPPATRRLPARPLALSQLQNPISERLRGLIRDARFHCVRRHDAAACARLRSLYNERRRIIRTHRARLRALGALPAKTLLRPATQSRSR